MRPFTTLSLNEFWMSKLLVVEARNFILEVIVE